MNEETLTRAVNKCQEISIKNVDWSARLLSHVSLVKQFNRRINETEKFWNPTQAETILQLCAAYLSKDDRLATHLKTRPISAVRSYQTTRTRKTA
jgi:hypothetical protein